MPIADQHDQIPDPRRAGLPANLPPGPADLPQAAPPPDGETPAIEPVDETQLAGVLAQNLETMASALYFYGSSGRIFPQLGTTACISYMTAMVEATGDPADPLERLLVEQLVQINHAVGRLLVKAAHVGTPEGSSLMHAAAARLLAEYRKGLLALKEYRSPAMAAGPQVTVVGNVQQQNVAGMQRVALNQHGGERSGMKNQEARLGTTQEEFRDDMSSRPRRSAALPDRTRKPREVARAQRRWP
jgi:hypothetical protein